MSSYIQPDDPCLCFQHEYSQGESTDMATRFGRSRCMSKLQKTRGTGTSEEIVNEIAKMDKTSTHRILSELAASSLMSADTSFTLSQHQATMLTERFDELRQAHPALGTLCSQAMEKVSGSIGTDIYKPNMPGHKYYPKTHVYPTKTKVSKEEFKNTELVRKLSYLIEHRSWPDDKEDEHALLADLDK